MANINITIQRNAVKGKREMAKTYNTAFEGDIADFDKLQKGIDEVVNKILWDKPQLPTEQVKKIDEQAS